MDSWTQNDEDGGGGGWTLYRAPAQFSNRPGPNPFRNAHEIRREQNINPLLPFLQLLRSPFPPLPLAPAPRERRPPARLAAARPCRNPSGRHCPRAARPMDGGGSGPAPNAAHTAEEVFRDYKARRAGMIKALTTGTPLHALPIGLLILSRLRGFVRLMRGFSLMLCRCGEVLQAL